MPVIKKTAASVIVLNEDSDGSSYFVGPGGVVLPVVTRSTDGSLTAGGVPVDGGGAGGSISEIAAEVLDSIPDVTATKPRLALTDELVAFDSEDGAAPITTTPAQIGDALAGYARQWSGRGATRGIPSNSSASIGVAGNAVTGFRTLLAQHPAVASFSGCWLVLTNFNTAAGITLQAARVTSTPMSLAPMNNDASLTWTAAAAATVAGVALPYTGIPAAAGNGGNVVPSVFSTDRIAIVNVARTDSATAGSRPLLRTAININDGAVVPSLSSANLTAYTTLADNPGFRYASRIYVSGTDMVNALGSQAPETTGGPFAPAEVVFDYDVPVRQVACFGDSNTQGQGTTSNWAAWPVRLMWQCIDDEVPVAVSNYAHAGQHHADSINTAIGYMPVIARTTKAEVFVSGWSPNVGADTDAVFVACRARILKAIAVAHANGLVLTVGTTPPVLAYSATQKARVAAQNVWVRGLKKYGARVFDIASILAPTGDTLPAYDVDGTHFNDTAHIAIATAARAHFA